MPPPQHHQGRRGRQVMQLHQGRRGRQELAISMKREERLAQLALRGLLVHLGRLAQRAQVVNQDRRARQLLKRDHLALKARLLHQAPQEQLAGLVRRVQRGQRARQAPKDFKALLVRKEIQGWLDMQVCQALKV